MDQLREDPRLPGKQGSRVASLKKQPHERSVSLHGIRDDACGWFKTAKRISPGVIAPHWNRDNHRATRYPDCSRANRTAWVIHIGNKLMTWLLCGSSPRASSSNRPPTSSDCSERFRNVPFYPLHRSPVHSARLSPNRPRLWKRQRRLLIKK
jgi:hypothetical protein